jgi:hypothetical protein
MDPRKAFVSAVDSVRTGLADPVRASQHLRAALDNLAALDPFFNSRRPPVSRIVLPQSFPTVTITPGSPGTVTTTSPVNVVWPRRGFCRGIAATVAEGVTYNALLAASVSINGDVNLFTNGVGGSYLPLSILSNNQNVGPSFFPVNWPVDQTDRWTVQFTSLAVIPTAGTASSYTPVLAFLFDEE